MRFQRLFLFAVLVSLLAVVPGLGYGQSQPTASTQQPSTTNAPQPPAQAQAAPIANAKPAKVWTNDEIDTLRSNHSVSVVGNRAPQKVSATSKGYSLEKDPAWYRRQLEPLRAEIDKLDAQIPKMQAFLNGENVGEQASLHPKMVPSPQEQLKQMEAKRQADAAKMDDLLDRARHNGIEPGTLR
jgi:phosphoenolpyruvate carboxylase